MSLRTDYFDGSTGLQQKIIDAFDAGSAWVTSNLTTIQEALLDAAEKGLTTFTVKVLTAYNPAILRGNNGNNYILKAYLAGITDGLAGQDVYSFECTPELNTDDSVTTYIDLNFSFQTT